METMRKSEAIYSKLLADRKRKPESEEVQDIINELDDFMAEIAQEIDPKERWETIIHSYSSSEYQRKMTDAKYGEGASDYIVKAVKHYEASHMKKTSLK